REPVLLLVFAAVAEDGVHDQRALHRGEAAHARVAGFQLLHDQAVRDVADARAAVLLRQVGAQQALLAEEAGPFRGEAAFFPQVARHGDDVLPDETAGHVAPFAPFRGERGGGGEKAGDPRGLLSADQATTPGAGPAWGRAAETT